VGLGPQDVHVASGEAPAVGAVAIPVLVVDVHHQVPVSRAVVGVAIDVPGCHVAVNDDAVHAHEMKGLVVPGQSRGNRADPVGSVADRRLGTGLVHHQLRAGVEQGRKPRRVAEVARSSVRRGQVSDLLLRCLRSPDRLVQRAPLCLADSCALILSVRLRSSKLENASNTSMSLSRDLAR
jgi:hypothetical protein